MLERNGFFTWTDENRHQGIEQNVAQGSPHYSMVRNMRIDQRDTFWKERGMRALSAQSMGSLDTVGGLDCHFNNGTQILVLMQNDSATVMKAWVVNADRSLTQQAPSFALVRPSLFMFTNQLTILDGTTLRQMDASKAWTTPGNATQNACTFGTVFAGRAILSGNSTNPDTFYPSEVRTITQTVARTAEYAYEVTEVGGDVLKTTFALGPFLIIGGRSFTQALSLGRSSPKDWTGVSLSSEVGPISAAHAVVTRGRGERAAQFGFFWSEEGPMMVARFGGGTPILISLFEPIERACRGENYHETPGIDPTRLDKIEIVYDPEYDEVVYAATKVDSSAGGRNDIHWRLNFASAVTYAQASADGRINAENLRQPIWRYCDNTNWDFPGSCLFQVQVGNNGLPSVTGQRRVFTGRDGTVYELNAPNLFKDLATHQVPFELRRKGYDGAEDGIREFEKSVEHVYMRCKLAGDYDLKVKMIADGGGMESEDTIDLAEGIYLWSSSTTQGTWGDGVVKWNAAEFSMSRGEFNCVGRQFEVRIYDDGAIEAEFGIDLWSFTGMLEDRR